MFKGVIFDFNRTIFVPNREVLMEGVIDLLDNFNMKISKMSCLLEKKKNRIYYI